MSQPPDNEPVAQWRRPDGVSQGTWDYVHQRAIADHYDAFVADTPLCQLDQQIIQQSLPDPNTEPSRQNPTVVLDLGCGTGRTILPLAERGYQVIGADLSESMLQQARAKATHQGVDERVHLLRANLVQLGCIANASVDHVVCMFSTLGMIQGRANRKRVLCHARRIIRPNGRFIVHVHNRWAAFWERHGIRHLVSSWLQSRFDRDQEFGDRVYAYRGLDKMFMHRFSHRELIHDLHESGWTTETVNCVSLVGKDMVTSSVKAGGFIAVCSPADAPDSASAQ